ncbi:transporter protein [Arthrobacter sp. Hiyo4]|nr:transporter protein [Arthrobacter sp. Hiyo4]
MANVLVPASGAAPRPDKPQFGTWIPVAIYVAVAAGVTAVGLALGRDSNTVEDEDYRLLLEGSALERQESAHGKGH